MNESNADSHMGIVTDASLLPALMSLVENAASASLAEIGEERVNVSALVANQGHRLSILVKDHGVGIPKKMHAQLGQELIESEQGMGMALLLSHASFERLGGRLLLAGLPEGGTVAEVSFPMQKSVGATT